MSDSESNHLAFEAISKRLSNALDELEAAVERQKKVEQSREGLIEELLFLRQEKQKLASELEASQARGLGLEKARDEVLIRLEKASRLVEAILASDLEMGRGD
jgi:phosphate starvation-inducible protein PhoH